MSVRRYSPTFWTIITGTVLSVSSVRCCRETIHGLLHRTQQSFTCPRTLGQEAGSGSDWIEAKSTGKKSKSWYHTATSWSRPNGLRQPWTSTQEPESRKAETWRLHVCH